MKTAIQQLLTELDNRFPQLLSTNTKEGKELIEILYPFIDMEKKQIEEAYESGEKNIDFNALHGHGKLSNSDKYYKETYEIA